MRKRLACVACVALSGCATEWRTAEPVAATTYNVPSHRSLHSIGRLARIAVMPVEVHLDADDDPGGKRRELLARDSQAAVVEYLVRVKGYEARAIDRAAPSTEPAAMRDAGLELGVDGVMVIERWFAQPWSTWKGVANLFLLNIPLFSEFFKTSLRVSLYETASGRLVWRRELAGSAEEARPEIRMAGVFGDLENAVPAALRR